MTERRARRLTCRRVGNNRVRPPVREIDRYTHISRDSLRTSVRKTIARARARERERGARALHGVPLPRATAARFKSVAPRPSPRRDFARYSLLSRQYCRSCDRRSRSNRCREGDERRSASLSVIQPCSDFFSFFYRISAEDHAITRVPRRRR